MLELAVYWLTGDREKRIEREIAEGGKAKRGAATDGETRDSEVFYKKYDYTQYVPCPCVFLSPS